MEQQNELDRLTVTVLAEDSVQYESPYLGQHGVSFLVEAEAAGSLQRILVDVAQNHDALLTNMKLMGIDPAAIDSIVLTHCHYDHTRGLAHIIRAIGRPDIPVVAHPSIFRPNFITSPSLRHVGIMQGDGKEAIEEAGGFIYLSGDPLQIMPGLTTSGEIERTTAFEEVGINLFTIDNGAVVPDPMRDDISLIAAVKDKGLVIITGCSHAGIINIAKQAVNIAGDKKIRAIIGGLHLIEATGDAHERIKKTVDALERIDPDRIYAGHCTGFQAQVELYNTFNERFSPLHTGMVIEIS